MVSNAKCRGLLFVMRWSDEYRKLSQTYETKSTILRQLTLWGLPSLSKTFSTTGLLWANLQF